MAARARIHATLVIAAALAATVASAEDRRLNIINEGMAPGTWQPVAETMAVPAYEQVVKASHNFNLLDARGVISVQERQSYILRIRELAKQCGEAWLQTAGGGAEQ